MNEFAFTTMIPQVDLYLFIFPDVTLTSNHACANAKAKKIEVCAKPEIVHLQLTTNNGLNFFESEL